MNIVDLSQIISATIWMGDAHECAKHPSIQSKGMIKHSIINSIRANFVLHKSRYGKMVLACDSGSWRNDVFKNYKCQRRAARKVDTSGINWDFVEEVKLELLDDLDNFFPFALVRVPKAEGDDCIGTLVPYVTKTAIMEEDIFGNSEPEPILITSSDKDNIQLHKYKNVSQWSPMDKKLVKGTISPRNSLIEKIVRGESGPTSDSIPCIRMGDDTFIEKIRQKPISAKYIQSFFDAENPIDACTSEEELKNYIRNEQLVSYEKIPTEMQELIISCYNTQSAKAHSKMKFMNYLTQNKMSNILGNIMDFYI